MRGSQIERAALNRDLVWSLLWGLHNPGWPNEGWATSTVVYEAWLGGRDQCGIAYAEDWIGPRGYFTYVLNRLVDEGRAERRRLPRKHPTYRAIVPSGGLLERNAK